MSFAVKMFVASGAVLIVVWLSGLVLFGGWVGAESLSECTDRVSDLEAALPAALAASDSLNSVCQMELDECMAVSRECAAYPTPEDIHEVLRVKTSNR